ncbi:MAG: hypothetical protein ACJAS9_001169 [Polaribacter sp.]|jgi:hypothetical protein
MKSQKYYEFDENMLLELDDVSRQFDTYED